MTFKKTLANAIFSRPIPLFDKINWNARAQKWRTENDGIPSAVDRFGFYDLVGRGIGSQAIDYLEFGVFQGESLRHWLGMNTNSESRFTGFDTFTGLPEKWLEFEAGSFDTGGALPDIADPRVRFVKGIFQDTLYDFLNNFTPRPQMVIHVDSDLFSSALFVLCAMDRFVVPGTIILFDEFTSLLDEFRAWQEYLLAFRRSARPIGQTFSRDQIAFRIE
ncbi:MAG TPA: class I SAM-dependent methyltransferase [Rhizomicrobium sp.]|nr:class I SAM-dependent methyltransferase [Rhizomicrobium sp.]